MGFCNKKADRQPSFMKPLMAEKRRHVWCVGDLTGGRIQYATTESEARINQKS